MDPGLGPGKPEFGSQVVVLLEYTGGACSVTLFIKLPRLMDWQSIDVYIKSLVEQRSICNKAANRCRCLPLLLWLLQWQQPALKNGDPGSLLLWQLPNVCTLLPVIFFQYLIPIMSHVHELILFQWGEGGQTSKS